MTPVENDYKNILDTLKEISSLIENTQAGTAPFSQTFGWNNISLSKQDCLTYLNKTIEIYETIVPTEIEHTFLNDISSVAINLTYLKNTVTTWRSNIKGTSVQAIPAILITLQYINSIATDILAIKKDTTIENMINNRLFSLEDSIKKLEDLTEDSTKWHEMLNKAKSHIDYAYKEAVDLKDKAKIINDASQTAQELPSLNAELALGAKKLKESTISISSLQDELKLKRKELSDNLLQIHSFKEEANDLLTEIKKTRNIMLGENLSDSFEAQEKSLKISVKAWTLILFIALGVATAIGVYKIHPLFISNSTDWPEKVLSLLSLSGCFWISWLSTQQINKSFTLSQDYAYKSALSRAYAGFQDEAKSHNSEIALKVLNTTVSRLDELPLRLIKQEDHNSPLHEIFKSPIIQKAGPEVISVIAKAIAHNSKNPVAKAQDILTKPNQSAANDTKSPPTENIASK